MPMLDLNPAAQEVRRLLDGVQDDQLSDATPCEGRPVAAMLDHLMGLTLAFKWAATKDLPPGAGGRPQPAADSLDPDWRTVLPGRLDALAEAWQDPQAWTGMTEAGGIQLPGEVAGLVALDEVVLHGWDLARATGQSFRCDPASAEAVLGFTEASARPDQSPRREGLFGPVVRVPDDAPVLDRALGFAGRDPSWQAPG
ncbi:TIGR03086 family metal-binding protein [Angustibacter sp. McL0619]|uniref:TIGR03086 family metal-binding protein n=1 Tax=Angustibacter sp. McL0619 TaxID=3415676 RepID=UPI003CE6F8D5